MIKLRNTRSLLTGFVLLLALCTLPGLVWAAPSGTADTDTVSVTVTIPEFLAVMLANESGTGTLTEMNTASWSPSETDMLNGIDLVKTDHGYLHTWANVNCQVYVHRTDNDFGTAGLTLLMKDDGGSTWDTITTTPTFFFGNSSPHANVNVSFKITGLNWATPPGTHTETVTATISKP